MTDFPAWVQWLLTAGAAVGAAAMIWSKVIKPADRIVSLLHDILPLLVELTEHNRKNPGLLAVLAEIASQFKADSGSTLRDVVNRLEGAAQQNQEAGKALAVKAGVLEVNVAAAKELAVEDRAAAAHRDGVLAEILDTVKRGERK